MPIPVFGLLGNLSPRTVSNDFRDQQLVRKARANKAKHEKSMRTQYVRIIVNGNDEKTVGILQSLLVKRTGRLNSKAHRMSEGTVSTS
jgi:hypothetical protein